MVKVIYDRTKLDVKITGHAKSGVSGHDLVCAAVTALSYTLAANVENLHKSNKKYYRRPMIKLAPGEAHISLHAVREGVNIARLTFNAVCVGFELLALNYPQNVEYVLK